jgi:hypothetical protein
MIAETRIIANNHKGRLRGGGLLGATLTALAVSVHPLPAQPQPYTAENCILDNIGRANGGAALRAVIDTCSARYASAQRDMHPAVRRGHRGRHHAGVARRHATHGNATGRKRMQYRQELPWPPLARCSCLNRL